MPCLLKKVLNSEKMKLEQNGKKKRVFRQKRISYKVILSLFIAQMFSVGIYVGERMLHSETEWMVFVYLLDEILILVLIRRIGMYEVADHIANALKEHSTYGFLVFDRRHNYLGCNEKVKEYLPEVSELRVDHRIGKENAFLYDNVELRLQQMRKEDYYIVRGEKELRCSVRMLYHGGSGYPDHLSGTGIPLEARIMALADVFDALVSRRCYKESMDYGTAFHIIEESLGSHFDPELGKVFIGCREQLTEYYDRVNS